MHSNILSVARVISGLMVLEVYLRTSSYQSWTDVFSNSIFAMVMTLFNFDLNDFSILQKWSMASVRSISFFLIVGFLTLVLLLIMLLLTIVRAEYR